MVMIQQYQKIFDLVQEINEKIKDLEYESEDYYI